jgi:hypothetical protein
MHVMCCVVLTGDSDLLSALDRDPHQHVDSFLKVDKFPAVNKNHDFVRLGRMHCAVAVTTLFSPCRECIGPLVAPGQCLPSLHRGAGPIIVLRYKAA